MRNASIKRKTNETSIALTLKLDGDKVINIDTKLPFFDHMLTALCYYAGVSIYLKADGDINVDDHHTVEDVGIVLGQAFKDALGDKIGINRFAEALTPMDESLSRVVIDISNRAYLVYNVDFKRDNIGDLSLENIREFFLAFANHAGITLHIEMLYGINDHHKAEAIFKGVGRALKEAMTITHTDTLSTKGSL